MFIINSSFLLNHHRFIFFSSKVISSSSPQKSPLQIDHTLSSSSLTPPHTSLSNNYPYPDPSPLNALHSSNISNPIPLISSTIQLITLAHRSSALFLSLTLSKHNWNQSRITKTPLRNLQEKWTKTNLSLTYLLKTIR